MRYSKFLALYLLITINSLSTLVASNYDQRTPLRKSSSNLLTLVENLSVPKKVEYLSLEKINGEENFPGKKLLQYLIKQESFALLYLDGLGGYTRNSYKVSIPHPINYRTMNPELITSLWIPIGKNAIQPKKQTEVEYPGNYILAKLRYAALLVGCLERHKWAKHVPMNLRQGVLTAIDIINIGKKRPYNATSSQALHLPYFRKARELLREVWKKYKESSSIDAKEDQRMDFSEAEYFSEIFSKRVQLLSSKLTRIAQKNSMTEEAVLDAIERRNIKIETGFNNDYLLILTYNLTEFLPHEAKLVRILRSDKTPSQDDF